MVSRVATCHQVATHSDKAIVNERVEGPDDGIKTEPKVKQDVFNR